MTMESEDRQAIRDVIEAWAIWRDSGDWDNLRTCWHDGAIMNATWFQGDSEQFIANAAKAFAKGGPGSVHFLGGTAIALRGSRAIAQTKMMISSRDEVDGAACDIVCTGRFYDFIERRAGRWGIVLRQPIYEKDRLDPVDPGARLELDPAVLARFPAGYRHLAYLQTSIGYKVKEDMPCLTGPVVEALYARGERWLAGGPL